MNQINCQEVLDDPKIPLPYRIRLLEALDESNKKTLTYFLCRNLFRLYLKKFNGFSNLSILELGSGSAGLTRELNKVLIEKKIECQFSLIDLDINVLHWAKNKLKIESNIDVNVYEAHESHLQQFKDKEFDFVVSLDVLHHIQPIEQLEQALSQALRVSKKGIWILDIERSSLGFWFLRLLNLVVKINPVIMDDGFKSIKRAYTSVQIRDLFAKLKVNTEAVKVFSFFPLPLYLISAINEKHEGEGSQTNGFSKSVSSAAYKSPPWWYDIRGFFILTFAYRDTLWNQVSFFNRNYSPVHLEAAIGTGSLTKIIFFYLKLTNRLSFKEFIGVDYSDEMLTGAKNKFNNARCNFIQSDLTRLPFPDSKFESINLANSFHCIEKIDIALKEMNRVLSKGAKVYLNVLLKPQKNTLRNRFSTVINTWGMKKGILYKTYASNEVENLLFEAGFTILSTQIVNNSMYVVCAK